MAVSYKKNRLEIDGRTFSLEKRIEEAVEYPDRVIVLFDDEDYASGEPHKGRNLIAVGRDGNILWRVADSNDLFPDSETSIEPFVGFEKTTIDGRETLIAYEMFGMFYEVDLQTGTLSNPVVSR